MRSEAGDLGTVQIPTRYRPADAWDFTVLYCWTIRPLEMLCPARRGLEICMQWVEMTWPQKMTTWG